MIKIGIFERTYIKLSLYYIAIIMFFSIAFSVSSYRISTIENQATFRRQMGILRDIPNPRLSPGYDIDRIIDEQRLELSRSNQKILTKLITLNFGVLVLGYICSYYMARRSLRPIKESNERLSTFAADASHELRTPLTSLKASTELNLAEKDIKKIKDSLSDNLVEINKFEYLINRILLSTKPDYDAPLKITAVNIEQIIDNINASCFDKLNLKNIKIIKKINQNIIQTDQTILAQILNEIVDNAIKYSPKNSSITIKSYKKGIHQLITVNDKGIGIPKDDIDKIFNKFYRTEKSRSSQGYGIGLSLVNDYIKILGGKIKVESTEKKGTTFSIIL